MNNFIAKILLPVNPVEIEKIGSRNDPLINELISISSVALPINRVQIHKLDQTSSVLTPIKTRVSI